MKTKINNLKKIAGILAFAIIGSSFISGRVFLVAAQEINRGDGGGMMLAATPTPTQKTPSSAASTAMPPSVPVQTLESLQSKIRSVLARPELQRGQVGVKIVSLDTSKSVFESNAEKYFMPASNMKSFTIAAALEKLSPDFRFATSVYAPAKPDADGIVKGDLAIYGRGDVSFSTAFYDGDYYKGLDLLAQKIVQAGVKKVEGNLVGDESYFSGDPIPSGWEWDDLQWYYGAEITALPVNDNAIDLKITPNSQIGMPCVVTVTPTNSLFTIINQTQTVSSGSKSAVEVTKRLNSNVLEIRGTMPVDDKGYTGYIAVTKPSELFVALLKNLLQQKGVIFTGQTRTVDYKMTAGENLPLSAKDGSFLTNKNNSNTRIEIARVESPPFSIIAAKTLKPSQNTYTETILRALGEQVGDKTNPAKTSAERGLEVVRNFLLQVVGIPADSVIQHDGSGLSRHDLITPAATVQLYTYMSKSRYANVWRDDLPGGGVDGTLKSRFGGTAAGNGNLHAKTGTIDQVSSLSGYVSDATGEKFVFSIIVNSVTDVRLRQSAIDEIVLSVANFNGKTN